MNRFGPARAGLVAALLLGLAPQASRAGEEQAEACLRERVWDGYADGWGIRTMTSTTLQTGQTRNYLVTLFKGNQYRIEACGDDQVVNVDVLLYDSDGKILARDESADNSPRIEFEPPDTGSYYVVVYQRELTKGDRAGVAMAVVYR